jgi:hypothetical protein
MLCLLEPQALNIWMAYGELSKGAAASIRSHHSATASIGATRLGNAGSCPINQHILRSLLHLDANSRARGQGQGQLMPTARPLLGRLSVLEQTNGE